MTSQRVTILGATGSIGRHTLDVIARSPARWSVHAVTAHRDVEGLVAAAREVRPNMAVVADRDHEPALREALDAAGLTGITVAAGEQALVDAAAANEADTVIAGIVGAAGLRPVLAAAEAGKRLLLANKEALVMAGAVVMDAVRRGGALLIPLDSEHNALFQCLPSGYVSGDNLPAGVERLTLTGSGGPFRERSPSTFGSVTPDEACRHPTWSMGRKISVDSATLMNKGLELIEACWLFRVAPSAVDVVIHPQSIVHSLVSYRDGSVLAQLAYPDMRTPIAHALAWPERADSGVASLDLPTLARLEFERPDDERFPCLRLAARALEAGAGGPAVVNAANEVAVDAFLAGRLRFDAIARVIEGALEAIDDVSGALDFERVMALDAAGRQAAETMLVTEGEGEQ
jgi:1-deoxy-D-xylulose-5-phosphate reductoisomerase